MELALDPAFELEELIVPEPEEPAFIRRPQSRWDVSTLPKEPDDEPEEPKERKIPERFPNLGASILLQAIEDYCGRDEREHRSAALFLFPTTRAYENRLAWAVGQTELALHPTRRALEALRGVWDAERKKRSNTWKHHQEHLPSHFCGGTRSAGCNLATRLSGASSQR
jgi:hypothetical protein